MENSEKKYEPTSVSVPIKGNRTVPAMLRLRAVERGTTVAMRVRAAIEAQYGDELAKHGLELVTRDASKQQVMATNAERRRKEARVS